ncbi:hypothetical protein [Endozoicomonas arenosclerae]|uniref:hypothetical protein n=1 Tax=Endozoicomonas arenosclerae TaxID=1633495 RepID=UPI0007863D76|nr:hypothetical protein [Endozoicomonas arenosclerae]
MTESSPSVDNQSGVTLTGTQGSVHLTDARRDSLRASGFSDAQIEALLSLADPDDSLVASDFNIVDKSILNSLQFSGQLTDAARQLVYVQTPVSLLNQVSDPRNWQGENYIGPGAVSVNSYLNGEPVDFSKPSLDALVFSVLSARAEIIEGQLRDQIGSIQEKNAQLEEANDWLARARAKKAEAGTSGTATFDQEFRDFWASLNAEFQENDNNTDTPILDHNSADWDVNIEGLRARTEGLTSQTQLETTQLQQTINRYNQAFEMMSNFINKYYQSLSTVIQNLR